MSVARCSLSPVGVAVVVVGGGGGGGVVVGVVGFLLLLLLLLILLLVVVAAPVDDGALSPGVGTAVVGGAVLVVVGPCAWAFR